MTEPLVATPRGETVPFEDGRLVLEEHRTYWIRVLGRGPHRVAFDQVELGERHDDAFVLTIGGTVGHAALGVVSPDGARSWPVWVRPRTEKLTDELFLTMVTELEAWLPGVLVGEDATRLGEVGLAGVAMPALVEALVPLAWQLDRALEALLERPREAQRSMLEDVRLHEARHVGPETLRWLARHPDVTQWLFPQPDSTLTGAPPSVPQRLLHTDLDHPANRYVAWLLDRTTQSLLVAAGHLRQRASAGREGRWARARATRLEGVGQRLHRRFRRSPLWKLRREPATEAARLVVVDDARYARLHRIARRLLSPLFRFRTPPDADLPPASRPSFELYELWCFLAVVRGLKSRLGEGSWRHARLQDLVDPDRTGHGATVTWSDGARRLTLELNARFPSLLARGNADRWSISTERRPDIVVTWRDASDARWLCLDAKYRVGHANLGDAFTSAHVYRDALRWPSHGGRGRGAMLLAPAVSDDTRHWFDPAFRAEHGCGVSELRPGNPDAKELSEWILQTLEVAESP